jgi:hypothetical protein
MSPRFSYWTEMDPSSDTTWNLRFCNELISLDLLAGEKGFEPPTPWSRTRSLRLLELIEIG